MPLGGGYHACKWALEAVSESLAQEVAGFGITVTVVEPGGFATRRGGEKPDPLTDGVQAKANPIYAGFRNSLAEFANNAPGGDPAAAAQALLKIVDADNPSMRVFFGPQGYQLVQKVYADRLKTWSDWQDLSLEAPGKLDQ